MPRVAAGQTLLRPASDHQRIDARHDAGAGRFFGEISSVSDSVISFGFDEVKSTLRAMQKASVAVVGLNAVTFYKSQETA
jgi:hypothetical protein